MTPTVKTILADALWTLNFHKDGASKDLDIICGRINDMTDPTIQDLQDLYNDLLTLTKTYRANGDHIGEEAIDAVASDLGLGLHYLGV